MFLLNRGLKPPATYPRPVGADVVAEVSETTAAKGCFCDFGEHPAGV